MGRQAVFRYGDLAGVGVYNMVGGDANQKAFEMSSFTPEEFQYCQVKAD
jgi:hypothetical protein